MEQYSITKFTRRQFIQCSALVALAVALPIRSSAAEGSGKLPNIIFIMVDDIGYRNLGCFGGKTILTPNIDRMCAEGIKFTDCYSGDSVCAPARSALMTVYHTGREEGP